MNKIIESLSEVKRQQQRKRNIDVGGTILHLLTIKMKHLKIILEYDGTGYSGWQRQPNKLTVQQAVENKLSLLLNSQVQVHSAGRTDAGVHAKGQAAHFTTEKERELSLLMYAFNSIAPHDIAITEIEEVSPDFHARKNALGKWYRYRVLNRDYPSPLERGYSWFVHYPLDPERMQEAAGYLTGTLNFSSFKGAKSDIKSSVRTVHKLLINRGSDGILTIDCYGNGFLKYMVRIMAGTLVNVGKGKIPPGHVKKILEARDRRLAGETAPPKGLCLMKVFYDQAAFTQSLIG